MALAESGPSLLTLGIIFTGDMNFTNSLSSEKLQCSLYGTSYLRMREVKATVTRVITYVWFQRIWCPLLF